MTIQCARGNSPRRIYQGNSSSRPPRSTSACFLRFTPSSHRHSRRRRAHFRLDPREYTSAMPVALRAPELQTDRLILRPLQLSDAPQTQRLFPHWEIVRLLNAIVPWPYPADGALTYYRDAALPAIERGDEWHWTLRLKQSSEHHIGAIALIRGEDDNRGFWLGLPWQGQGSDDRSRRCRKRLLVRCPWLPRPSRPQGGRKPRLKTHLRKNRHARRRHRGARLRLRQAAMRDMGDDSRRMAQTPGQPSRTTTSLETHPPRAISSASRQSPHPQAFAVPTPYAAYCEPAPPFHPAPEE